MAQRLADGLDPQLTLMLTAANQSDLFEHILTSFEQRYPECMIAERNDVAGARRVRQSGAGGGALSTTAISGANFAAIRHHSTNRQKMLILLASVTFAVLLALFLLRKEFKTRGFLSTYNRNARSDARLQRSRTIKPH